MALTEPVDGIPFWTERMYRPGGGQDHLGLGSVVTDRILPRLSPGINVLTVRPRYWSFYSFVLSEFWSRDLPRTRAALRDWYRPMECIYSVACTLCEHEEHRGQPVGTRRIASLVATEPDGFDPEFDYMDSPMGGYGLYYGTVMQSIGLVALADRRLGLPVDTVTPDGQLVADAFRSVISDTAYYQDWIGLSDERVPVEVVREYADVACLCRLRDPAAPDRPLLVDAFLHHGADAEAAARRATLRMFCELATQTDPWPIGAGDFRRLIYFRSNYGDEEFEGPTFEPGGPLLPTARRWRLYQAREYYNASINEMWRRLTCWGLEREGDLYPIPMKKVLDAIDVDFDALASAMEVERPAGGLGLESPFHDLLDWLSSSAGVTGELDDPWDLDGSITEDLLLEFLEYGRADVRDTGADRLAAAVALLGLVAARLWKPELGLAAPVDWFPVVEGHQERLGMQRFLTELRRRVADGQTIGEVVTWLHLEYVIEQHERVANAKLHTTGDTYRFRREAGRLRFFPKETRVGMNDSRFNANATVIYELGLAGYLFDEQHPLSDEGERLRSEGDLPPTGAFTESNTGRR
jgi:hypothetical protein